ncbi:MAG: metalloregulator ArsR/SmtB family transcription factor [Dehalococcoidia bacterium]
MEVNPNYILELQAEMLGALSNPKRLMILKVLGKGEKTVGEIAVQVGIEMQNTSQHLRIMKAHGIVSARRDSQTVYYELTTPIFAECCELVRKAIVEDLEKRSTLLQEIK